MKSSPKREDFFMGARILQSYKLVSMLSLDVVAGALISALFFSQIFQSGTYISELIALMLTVWIIYTADHLADARKIRHAASTDRHRFHQKHVKKMRTLLVFAVLLDGVAVTFMEPETIRWGVILALLVLVFLIIQQSIPWMKEMLIALFYTCGVLLPSVVHRQLTLHVEHYLLILQFAMIALTNLLLFSWLDRATDSRDGLRSFVTVAGERSTRIIIVLLAVTQLGLTIIQLTVYHVRHAAILLCVMGVVLEIIFLSQRKYDDHTVSRFIAEAVFLIPIVSLLL